MKRTEANKDVSYVEDSKRAIIRHSKGITDNNTCKLRGSYFSVCKTCDR